MGQHWTEETIFEKRETRGSVTGSKQGYICVGMQESDPETVKLKKCTEQEIHVSQLQGVSSHRVITAGQSQVLATIIWTWVQSKKFKSSRCGWMWTWGYLLSSIRKEKHCQMRAGSISKKQLILVSGLAISCSREWGDLAQNRGA